MLVIREVQLASLGQDMRRRLALEALEDVRNSSPHAVRGLTPAEVEERLETALEKSLAYPMSRDDVKAFVRLCFTVGPRFDEYPRFQEIWRLSALEMPRMLALFAQAEAEDWNRAAQFDILSRCLPQPGYAGRVSLTRLEMRHASAYHLHALHPDVWRLGRTKPLMALAEVQDLIREREGGYAITGEGQEFLGALFVDEDGEERRISYWVARSWWGQGIATEALRQATSEPRGRSVLTVDAGNLPSIRVAEKCGYRMVGEGMAGWLTFEAGETAGG